jgi:Protein of unknown function (DUF3795)
MTNSKVAASCGLYCGSCGIYLATQENDTEKLLQYAIVLNQSIEETLCDGCRADRKSAHCSRMCLFIKCTLQKGIEFCGTCPEFPCKELTDFQSKMPHRVEILESQSRLMEIGWEQWHIEMKDNYSCPECNTVNTAYDLICRNCGYTPSCKFVLQHMQLIDSHLEAE